VWRELAALPGAGSPGARPRRVSRSRSGCRTARPPGCRARNGNHSGLPSGKGEQPAGSESLYAIYEGILGSWYSHDPLVCEDSGAPLEETVGPGPGDLYYLLVPRNDNEEGAYGSDSIGAPRPAGASPCVTPRVLAPCPP